MYVQAYTHIHSMLCIYRENMYYISIYVHTSIYVYMYYILELHSKM